ncbi:hypothetical protein HYDPIDRAFT_92514 [Hydnomerulius pinastri MD-312]|uniref:Uncharacterized protein n=1 Tax=Hydnomerulius pinastri MD-312 TaxID=994086 RepID=A0A0C9VYJ9_9AGAM|nr:hypothetical protein HYDPIDRAFT_92514 [Hydnomerulius pinastri MD-312]
MDVAANWQRQQQQQQLTTATHTRQSHHPQREVHTTHRFPSTHRHSPSQQHLAGPSQHHHPVTLANDLSQDSRDPQMRAHVENSVAGFPDLGNTSTGQSHALNLDGSPSWNSAMTQMQMPEFDHFYQAHQDQLQGRLPPLDSSHQHLPSHSSIEHHSQASHYSQELSRQQLQQLRQQQHRLDQAQARRHSGEGEYLQHLGATFHPHQQHQQPQHTYFPLTEEPSQLHPYQTHHGVHDPSHPQLPSPPPLDPSTYTQTRHPLPQMQRPHLHYLDEESPNMKYDPPSLLHTPPLHLE